MNSEQHVLGTNLRRLRKEKHISLEEIAKSIGVSKSFLSQVETGKARPSLSTLKEVAGYLDTSISALLEEESYPDSPVMNKEERNELVYSHGIKMEMLTRPQQFKQLQPMYFSLEPGATSGAKQYRHFGQEFVYVLSGFLEVHLDKDTYTLEEGDSIYFESSKPHAFLNPSQKEKTEALWIDTPPTF